MADPLLEIRGLNKKFGDFQALKDINLELDKGLMIGLIGPNGCGISTML